MKIGIRGLGLIGGSFEKAFRARGEEVADLKNASAEEIASCQLVIVALPPLMVAPWVRAHADDFSPGAIVVDAAGVKTVVMEALEGVVRNRSWTFVGGHPMAGKERSGYANAVAELFQGASMILTPFEDTRKGIVEELERVFRTIGFERVVVTSPAEHDEMIAYTSQLAHVVSSAYVRDELAARHVGFSAGSFQDMTRVATVDPEIWKDLFLANGTALGNVLSRLIDRLGEYREAIRDRDASRLKALLIDGRRAKEMSH